MKIKNITGYGEGRKGEDVARHKRITCKRYSHAKNRMMKRYTGTRMIKGETGDGRNDEWNGGDGKEWRTVKVNRRITQLE